ncbi:MAG: cytochrome P450 [Polyangiaceae bacterium]
MSLPPGPSLPPLLTTAAFVAMPAETISRLYGRYGGIFTIRTVAFGTEIVISSPDSIRQVLTGDSDIYGAAEANEALGFLLGDRSLLLLDGPPHTRLRKLMLPPFHGERLQPLTSTMRDATVAGFSHLRPGDEVSLQPLFQRVTLDIILRAVLGLSGEEERTAALREALTAMVNYAQSPIGLFLMNPKMTRFEHLPFPTPWSRLRALMNRADALLFEHADARRAQEDRPGDLLDMLLDARDEDGKPMSNKELRDQLVTLLLAGHETTATSLCWAMEEILHHPGEVDRLRAEVEEVTSGAPLTTEHVSRLTRLDSVVRETLRLYPVTTGVGRTLKRPVTIEGYDLPAGVMAAPYFALLHRRPEIYPDPHSFVPDRFVGKKIDPYEWMPFGAGAHRCLGMHFALLEMKVVLATLFANHRLSSVKKKGTTGLRAFVLSPRGGTWARVN